MKVSIITVSRNSAGTIEDTILSVTSQTYHPVEHIIVDGASTDGTEKILDRYRKRIDRIVQEPDNGIYDAMNKGIRMASGEIVGTLNADDFYANTQVIEKVVKTFIEKKVDSIFANLLVVERDDPEKVFRYIDSRNFHPGKFAHGWMPPHPTFFVKRTCYEEFGLFKDNYEIAADYELMVRFLARHSISYAHLDEVVVKMRKGGVSSYGPLSNWILNKEIVRACRENGIRTNLFCVLAKYPLKFTELVKRPRQ